MSNIYVLLVSKSRSHHGQSLTLTYLRPLSSSPLSSVTPAREEVTITTRDIRLDRSLWGDNTFLSYIKFFPSSATPDQTITNQSKTIIRSPVSSLQVIIFIRRRFQQKPRLTAYSSVPSTDTSRVHQLIRWMTTTSWGGGRIHSNFASGGEKERKYSKGESLMLSTILRARIFSTRRKTMLILLTREPRKQR